MASGTASTIYALLKTSTQAALAAVGKTAIDIFLWHQGEADNTGAPDIYYKKFQALQAQLNAETWCDPFVPIIAGGMRPTAFVGASQTALAFLNLNGDPQTSCASVDGLDEEVDGHITGAGLWELGYNRYWDMLVGQMTRAQLGLPTTSFPDEPATFAKYPRADASIGMYKVAAYAPDIPGVLSATCRRQ